MCYQPFIHCDTGIDGFAYSWIFPRSSSVSYFLLNTVRDLKLLEALIFVVRFASNQVLLGRLLAQLRQYFIGRGFVFIFI